MARAKQPVSIDGITFDALMEATESHEASVPSYPVETGFEISDSIIIKPVSLTMTLFVTNTPVTWKEEHGGNPSRVQDVVQQLKAKYFAKQPVTITTTDETYKNMAIVSLELSKTKENGTSREIPISFQEIAITEARTTTIPDSYGKSGSTGVSAGTANTTASTTPATSTSSKSDSSSSGTGSKSSILYGLASGSGLF